jgi:hypothetical protein
MHRIVLLPVILLLLSRGAFAQVTAEILLDQEQFIPGEDVEVSVRIVNRSGETLKLGGEPDWLTFTVEGKSRAPAGGKTAQVPVEGEFTLESAKMATKTVRITPYFNFTTPGRYQITAFVRIPGWKQTVVSNQKTLQIGGGTKLWEVEFGVPDSDNPNQRTPEVRKYSLVKSAQPGRMTMYVRVADRSDALLFKVTEVGPLVSFSRPEPQLDRFSNLHVLWQSGARTYTYTAVNPDGQLFIRQTYDFEASLRPRLAAIEETGRIKVIGGERRKMPTDVPPE